MKCDTATGWCCCGEFHTKASPPIPEAAPVSKTPVPAISAAARELGRLGGRKGGHARARVLSPARRSEIARKAARARWEYPFGAPQIH